MPAIKSAAESPKMNAEQAIAAAFNYMKSLPKNAGEFGGLRLEEIEEGKGVGKGKWMITISHTVPRDIDKTSDILAGLRFGRSYKVITIDSATGKVVSMKIRKL